MVAMRLKGRWLRRATVISIGAGGFGRGACGGSSSSDDDDDGSGATTSDGGTGGSGRGGASGTGGGSGKGGTGGGSSGSGGGAAEGGGSAAMGGGSGASNTFVSQLRTTVVDKVDLLLMLDNSLSMIAKQQILADAVPLLMARIMTPQCVDAEGKPTGDDSDATGHCATGAPEFQPIRNVHVGVITSSLGDHGSGDVCSDAQNAANVANGVAASQYNDLAQLLPSVRPTATLTDWNNSGFLVWDPRDQAEVTEPHANLDASGTQADAFVSALQDQVVAAGQNGCGYEAQLESWYRFLVDPEPVTSLTHDSSLSVRGPVNTVVLQQRQQFLRPDSALVLLMLTDENDCSIIDEDSSQGWAVGYKGGVTSSSLWHMPRATSACATNPNDKCCAPCSGSEAAGCPAHSTDAACSMGASLPVNEDSMNLRCFNQRGRFGVELLYPVQRYIDGLTKLTVTPRFGGPEVPNPLFAAPGAGQVGRSPGQVIAAGIVGVPWQDLSTEESWDGRSLTYLDSSELVAQGRWDVLLGEPATNVPPADTLMVESIDPRTSGAPATNSTRTARSARAGARRLTARKLTARPTRACASSRC